MQTLYCISGMGADEEVFKHLDLSFVNPVFIKWIKPQANETLPQYAHRLRERFIHDEAPIILGLSLGGMMAVEIAKTNPSAKVIIISSAKTKYELPVHWKFFRYLPLYKILPEWTVKKQSFLRNYFLGAKYTPQKKYLEHVARNADIHFYRWGIGAILNWQNEIIPSNVTHIHGTNDKLLPYQFVKADFTINNGGHLMVINNAREVSSRIKEIISS
ncbi:MAG TPA: alpha/beta hydrolase [Parafilimonas sp.]|nr:alpha/beta hydrolase [Parafilimonas sp.]